MHHLEKIKNNVLSLMHFNVQDQDQEGINFQVYLINIDLILLITKMFNLLRIKLIN
jgi:hypothetical protein